VTDQVIFESRGDVGVLTLNNPARLNAISVKMMSEALALVERLSRARSVRALVITGAGPGFCVGADLSPGDSRGRVGLEKTGSQLTDDMRRSLNPLVVAITEASFPVVAALNGAAAGAGVGLALACDLIVAARSAQLLLAFSRIGMGLDAGTSWFLAHTLGHKRAVALAMLAEPLTSANMLELGIAWQLADDDQILVASIDLAERLARGPTRALAEQKRQLRLAHEWTLSACLDAEALVQSRLVQTDDAAEGIAAYRGKRIPRFNGR